MRIAICDDNERELERLSALIAEYQLSRRVSFDCRFFHNGTDFLCETKGGEYDLVLLDVLMQGESGVQIARELRKRDKNVRIIFVSSSPEFAVESYSVEAYHYLLKPVDAGLLFRLLDKVGSELAAQEEQGFVLKNREGIVRISFTRLEYVEVINKTVVFHLADGTVYEVKAALADYEGKLLDRKEFIKTHRSYLVNLGYVQAISANCVVTKGGNRIPVSRQRHSRLQDAYMCYLRQAKTAVSSEAPKHPDGPWRILLVDDDPAARVFWGDILRRHGCIVQLAENGRSALKLAAGEPFDCVLLDVMIPGEDGFSVCERLRRLTDKPIIFLSSFTESDKQIEGFAAGGIDYITKDTPAELFWVKVETRIRLAASECTQLRYGPLLLDLTGRRVTVDGRELLLTSTEFDILRLLSERAEHIFTPQEIFDIIQGDQPWDGGQTVRVNMSRLRRKLEKAWGEHCFIEAVWGQGYRFVPVRN